MGRGGLRTLNLGEAFLADLGQQHRSEQVLHLLQAEHHRADGHERRHGPAARHPPLHPPLVEERTLALFRSCQRES